MEVINGFKVVFSFDWVWFFVDVELVGVFILLGMVVYVGYGIFVF